MRRIVISGGPGFGKTTLIDELWANGYDCIPEVSRALIREQVNVGGPCLPWTNLACFAGICLDKMVSDFHSLTPEATVFFDRGIPDIIAYLRTGGLKVPELFIDSARRFRYETDIFITPAWEEIYVKDEERWQSYEEAKSLSAEITRVYRELEYRIWPLPLASVAERVEFVLTKTKELEIH